MAAVEGRRRLVPQINRNHAKIAQRFVGFRRLSTKLVLTVVGLAGLALIGSSINWSRWERAPAPRTVGEYPSSRTVARPTTPEPGSVRSSAEIYE
jgi:hypothetical protein